MKTRRQWFNTLPEDIKLKAMKATKKNYGVDYAECMKTKCSSLEESILFGFTFSENGGFFYWDDVIKKYSQCTE